MSNDIVQVAVSLTSAGTPSNLQRKGAFVSPGGTTKPDGSLTLLSSLSDLTPILAPGDALASLTWSGSVVTGTTTSPHGWTTGDIIFALIAGATPAGYNGKFQITITGASAFTYPLVSNPGSETIPGTVTLYAESELLQMATTYFANGSAAPVYVLELGESTVAEALVLLATWITNNPKTLYSYEVPRGFTVNAAFPAFLANYTSSTAKTYFFCAALEGNYTDVTGAPKCAFVEAEAPNLPATEFSPSAAFYTTLNYAPSSTNKVPPLSFAFQFGVTAYPLSGNQTLLASLKTAFVNYIDTGAEGGLTNTILKWGTLMDGKPFNYWYSVDWVAINSAQALSNEVINGSNTSLNPLYYDQPGINRLQAREAGVMSQAISYGLATGALVQTQLPIAQFLANFNNGVYLGQVVVNAEPFTAYTAENPNDFGEGIYNGISIVYAPARGFTQILVNLNVTDFV